MAVSNPTIPGLLRLLPWINVKDRGARGDGSDASDAFVAAAASLSETGGTLFIPAGSYIVRKTIPLPDNCRVVFDPAAAITVCGDGDGGDGSLLTSYTDVRGDDYRPLFTNSTRDGTATNIHIEGNGAVIDFDPDDDSITDGRSYAAVWLHGVKNCSVRGLRISNVSPLALDGGPNGEGGGRGFGVLFSACQWFYAADLHVNNCGYDGIRACLGSRDGTIERCSSDVANRQAIVQLTTWSPNRMTSTEETPLGCTNVVLRDISSEVDSIILHGRSRATNRHVSLSGILIESTNVRIISAFGGVRRLKMRDIRRTTTTDLVAIWIYSPAQTGGPSYVEDIEIDGVYVQRPGLSSPIITISCGTSGAADAEDSELSQIRIANVCSGGVILLDADQTIAKFSDIQVIGGRFTGVRVASNSGTTMDRITVANCQFTGEALTVHLGLDLHLNGTGNVGQLTYRDCHFLGPPVRSMNITQATGTAKVKLLEILGGSHSRSSWFLQAGSTSKIENLRIIGVTFYAGNRMITGAVDNAWVEGCWNTSALNADQAAAISDGNVSSLTAQNNRTGLASTT